MSTLIGPSTNVAPYVVPSQTYVTTTSLLTVGDGSAAGGQWKFVGIPDGMGAFDNGDGTATVLVNHELGAGAGIVRAHGSTGAFVDVIKVDIATGEIISGGDLAQTVNLWTGSEYVSGTTAFGRLCSGDLAQPSAYYNVNSGLGTNDRIYLTGEESGAEGRAFAFVATGEEAGSAYELPWLGNMSFENLVASPASGDKTVVVATDDSGGGQVYVYIGQKSAEGSIVEKAGLTGGQLYGIKVAGLTTEGSSSVLPTAGSAFTLEAIGDDGDASGLTGAQIQTESVSDGVTAFLRPEDGAWDPSNPNKFYFVTTDSFGGQSKLWALEFNNIEDPTAGGTVKLLLDGTEGQRMFDNITVTDGGLVILQEDPGNNAHLARIWMYDPAADSRTIENPAGNSGLTEIAKFDPAKFVAGAADYIGTQDEESSGIIDVTSIFGEDEHLSFLFDAQVHMSANSQELVEKGQLLKMDVDLPLASNATILGTKYDDRLTGTNQADVVDAGFGDDLIKGGAGGDRILGNYGDDTIDGGEGDDILIGGTGNDDLSGRQGNDELSGDVGDDRLEGGQGNDLLDGGVGSDFLLGGQGADSLIGGFGDDQLSGNEGKDILDGGNGWDVLVGGKGDDVMTGGFGADTFVFARGDGADRITDFEFGVDHLDLGGAAVRRIFETDTDDNGVADATVVAYAGGMITLDGVMGITNTADLFV